MSNSIAWAHIGDLHMDEADGWASLPRLSQIVAELNENGRDLDFVYLPGDNANHASAAQYDAILGALAPLSVPWRVVPGDHDFEGGCLSAYESAFGREQRPEVEVIAGHRCIFIDVVSGGCGGPDFRLTTHHAHRVARELERAQGERQTPLVFMHVYPGDLATGGEQLARMFADARVAFVDTGHTHYNELLNDSRVIYGATRSIAQIEDGDGLPGFSVVCVHDTVPSWRFRPLGAPWPHVQIVSPCDLRLVTATADPRQVLRPGAVRIVARLFGVKDLKVTASIDSAAPVLMMPCAPGLWEAIVEIKAPGLHLVTVSCGDARDSIECLVRYADALPKRPQPVALGHSCHAIGAWNIAGIDGFRLGPNRHGGDW